MLSIHKLFESYLEEYYSSKDKDKFADGQITIIQRSFKIPLSKQSDLGEADIFDDELTDEELEQAEEDLELDEEL